MINGLQYIPAYLSPEQQNAYLEIIDTLPWLTDLKRRVQHYGYRYDYKRRAVDASLYLGGLPDWAATFAQRLYHDGYVPYEPDQLIVNEYLPGQGIARHIDCQPCFGDTILSITLAAGCVMDFYHTQTNAHFPIWLEPGSLVVMQGEARYDWKHGIAARKADMVEGQKVARGRRVSLTFRNVVLST